MNANPFLGVFFHWLGGLASGSFYVPFRFVKRWSWETYWLVGGVFSWIIAPWVIGALITPRLANVLGETSAGVHFWVYFWGVMWGLGGLTFGLTMRYLGMSLGMAMVLGWCAAVGTLAPPIYKGTFQNDVLQTFGGNVILAGVVLCLVGIAISGIAGMSKEREMPEEQKKDSIKEFNFKKGILVATFSGVFSACFAIGLDFGTPIKQATLKYALLTSATADGCHVVPPTPQEVIDLTDVDQNGTKVHGEKLLQRISRIKDSDARIAVTKSLKGCVDPQLRHVVLSIAECGKNPDVYLDRHRLWMGLPALIVILLGGFTTNFLWCVYLNVKNKTAYQYLSPTVREGAPQRDDETIIESAFDAPSEEVVEHIPGGKPQPDRVPLVSNYFFSALAGTTWYFQFFFYQMGESQMGEYGFASWTLHMASIIIFSTLWGIALREWKGSSQRTIRLVTLGLAVLIGSTIVVGLGTKMQKDELDKLDTSKTKTSVAFNPHTASPKEFH
jgi:hypothetical protein